MRPNRGSRERLGTSTNSPGLACASENMPPRGDGAPDIAAAGRTGKASPYTLRASAEAEGPDRNTCWAMSKPTVTRAVIVTSPASIGCAGAGDTCFNLPSVSDIGAKSEPSVIEATRPRVTPTACAKRSAVCRALAIAASRAWSSAFSRSEMRNATLLASVAPALTRRSRISPIAISDGWSR
jgi:hypothetical protein